MIVEKEETYMDSKELKRLLEENLEKINNLWRSL